MTSKVKSKCSEMLGKRRHSPVGQLPPPATSSKPLTPFGIEDILSKPCAKRSRPLPTSQRESGPSDRPPLGPSSPLCALEELASKTFRGLEVSVLQAAEGNSCSALCFCNRLQCFCHLFSLGEEFLQEFGQDNNSTSEVEHSLCILLCSNISTVCILVIFIC